ncbi:MAG: signal recognition particle protein [Gammaproteobacteria bacterium]|nr:signal recognition particle protein [Gammaproteobacteria bacterium]
MFENLTERLGQALKNLRGQARLTDDNIKEALREVRMALLEADVALPVVKEFVDRVRERAVGQDILQSMTPGQALIRVVRDELVAVMGEHSAGLELNVAPPAVILLAGLQGSGKTTTAAKLARWIREQLKKKVLVVSVDVYRPAAIAQLETLAGEVGVGFFPCRTDQDPVAVATAAVDHARKQFIDVVIVDTAGRLHLDVEMMDEARRLHAALHPVETLFVVDSMTGQDAANTAKAFHDALALTGVILTKTDGDARGGAALSLRHITGKPIKFLGVGEKTAALEVFHPERIASRILGMGDILSLIEEAERNVDRNEAEKLARKLKQGKGFDLEDFRAQLQQMRNMGGVASLLDKLPGMSGIPQASRDQVNDRQFIHMEAIINSMTSQERRFPAIIKASRTRRIAAGAGVQVQEINRMLKQFEQMQRMMKQMSKGGMNKLMRSFKGKLPF